MPKSSLPLPARSNNEDPPPRPVQRASRLDDIENKLETIQQTLDVQFKRIAALQAELDVLSANVRGH